ncbi:hypothetical protein [Inediibacterium massiliense]|uniref:hypothetical protein n=1 Tax=Inediibacterium massiliense TaxID=1658111 RepID=UPI0006B43DBD|nr:hypothetical protein [Inediibacterium massiliense]
MNIFFDYIFSNGKKLAGIFYSISAIFICTGFYKMFCYDSGESYTKDPVNAYVGGDAYNYIINSNYATGYFVLALSFTILGSTALIIESLNKLNKNKTSESEIEELKED